MVHIHFPIIFDLHVLQKVITFFMGYRKIVLMFILKFILHGCRDSVLSGNANYIFIELFFADLRICLLKVPALHRMWR